MGMLWKILKAVLIVVLPFFMLIRGSTYIHSQYDLGAWMSLGGGVLATTFLLFLYMTFVYKRFNRSFGDADNLRRRSIFAFLLVGLYCGYGLFFISSDNVKNPDLQKEIKDLHPILRLGVSTFILMDKNMIITDASRVPEDYRKMGLEKPGNSLHYKQRDGYSYALDLRTNNRNEFRNTLMNIYFRFSGFRTIRHGGTGDHLHVSLMCHYRRGGI